MVFEWWMAAIVGWLAVEIIKIIASHKQSVRTVEEDQQVIEMVDLIRKTHLSMEKVRSTTRWLREMHDIRDDDGLPLWYMPRAWIAKQEKVIDAVGEINHTLKDVAHVLEKLNDKLS